MIKSITYNNYIKILIISILIIMGVICIKPVRNATLRNNSFLNIFARYYFDEDYYITHYPDVKNTNISPFKHYVKFGWKENKNPNASFNTGFYVYSYLTTNKYNLNPLAHYVRSKLLDKNSNYTVPLKVSLLENPKYYLSLAAIFQNEARFLKEWIEFHLNLGVEHFYLYNNLSTDNYMEVLEPYIRSGIVDLKDINERVTCGAELAKLQIILYKNAIREVKDVTEWLIVTDIDEFLFPVKDSNLKEVLKKYDDYAAVAVNWRVFGSSDVEKIPSNKLMIESLLYSSNINNQYVKTIMKPRYVEDFRNPHYPNLAPGYAIVKENFEFFSENSSESSNILRINHYWARDWDFYRSTKLVRLHKIQEKTDEEKKNLMDFYIKYNQNLSVDYDDSILRFAKDIRKRMALND